MSFIRKRFVNSVLIITFLGAMAFNTGCGDIAQGSVMSDSELEEELAGVMQHIFINPEQQVVVDNCQDAITIILKNGSKAFFQNYAVDENFLWWFASHYGEEELMTLVNVDFANQTDASAWYYVSGSSMHALWAEYCRDMSFDTGFLSNISFREAGEDGCVTMDFIGDLCLAEDWYINETMDQSLNGIFSSVSLDILNELNRADLTIENNEFVISDRGEATWGKDYIFCGSSNRAQLLQTMGIDLASLANNHVYDHGEESLLDTMAALNQQGIVYVGAGADLAEAMKAQYFVVGGKKIGFVAGTQVERYTNFTKEATETTAGVLKTKDPTLLCQAIAEAKKNCDYLVVYPHWGTESYIREENSQLALARAYVDAGADLIVGSHPHRLEGIEYIDGVPVVYSLGNFLLSNGSLYTSIAQITIDAKNETHVKMLPCIQRDCKVSMITDEEGIHQFNCYMADVSNSIGILPNGEYVDSRLEEYMDYEFPYRSAKSYGNWSGDIDLDGRSIDIVGNLK